MTTTNLMALPVDIPWRRLATSTDMLDRKYGDSRYPSKWFSSLSVFYYEPDAEEQTVEGRSIAFLKVSCTVAGLQVLQADESTVSVNPDLLDRYPWAIQFFNKKNQKLARTYPCFGALLQIAVFPQDEETSLSDYPIIMDFEPKKRELYESAVENKQFMSGSRSSLSVKKSTRVVDSQETSWNLGGSLSASGDTLGAEASGGFGRKFGTSVETVDSITTDHSREKRENYAYTTNLTHMYHLLRSYHVGTNRAMFSVKPRPHITESEFVFTSAPQKLEGIQEFFIIVDRPSSSSGLCVEATLETAHLLIGSIYKARIIRTSSEATADNAKKTASALGLGIQDKNVTFEALVYGGQLGAVKYPGWNNIAPSKRHNITLRIGFGYGFQGLNALETKNGSALTSKLEWDNVERVVKLTGINPTEATEDLSVIYETAQQQDGTIAILGRTSASCTGRSVTLARSEKPFLAYECPIRLPDNLLSSLSAMPIGGAAQAAAANQLNTVIDDVMMDSISSPDRLPYGEVSVEQSRFVQDAIADAMEDMPDDDPYNVAIEAIDGIDSDVQALLSRRLGIARRKDALRYASSDLRVALGLGDSEARALRARLIGDGPTLVSGDHTGMTTLVPDVLGIPLAEARNTLRDSGLQVPSDVVYQEAAASRDVVLNQFPPGATVLSRGADVTLIVSQGGVDVPDVIGMDAVEAAAMLEGLSLRVLDETASSDAHPGGVVLDTAPAAGTTLARNAQVILLVNSANPQKG